MISKAKWQTYIQKLAVIDEKAAEMIRQYIDTNGLENSQELIEYAHGIVTKYGEASAELSCEMYDLMAETQGVVVPPAEPADTATIDEVSRGVMYGKYHSPNQIPSIVGRQVRQAGADTMLKNAIRDQAEWAWIPSGDTCAFCITLASRGWQKASKKVLKGDHAEHIHANCDCTFGIAFNEKGKREYDSIYDPQKYEDMYYGADGSTPKQRINSIRRARYQLNKDYINAQKRDAYQARQLDISQVQAYRSSKTDLSKSRTLQMGITGDSKVSVSPAEGYNGKIFISDKLSSDPSTRVKPKQLKAINSNIDKARRMLGIENKENLPTIVILDGTEFKTTTAAMFSATDNILYFGINMQEFSKETAISAVHEYLHWMDAQEYVSRFGHVTKENYSEYISYLDKTAKEYLENHPKQRDNILSKSAYARKSYYFTGHYNETYTELRAYSEVERSMKNG